MATITEAKLSSWEDYLTILLFCLVATSTFLALEIYAGFWPEPAPGFPTRVGAWIDSRTNQVIIIVSLLLGLWLEGKSIYLVVT